MDDPCKPDRLLSGIHFTKICISPTFDNLFVKMKAKKLYITVINDLSGDQRVHRIGSSLSQMGFEVHVVGRKLPDSPPLPDELPYATHRMQLFFRKGKFFYLEYNIRLFFFLLFRRIDLINTCDLDTLLPGYLISRFRGKTLVYDSHEYFTEVPELIHRPATRRIWLKLEGYIVPRLKHMYTVNASLARIYRQKYQVDVGVIRNLPHSRPTPLTSHSSPPILLYQGALNLGRGIELMVDAMQFLPSYQLWIIGRGDIEEELRQRVKDLNLEERVIFKGFVPRERLASFTVLATLGMSLEENLGKNYFYASPNKVVDYIQARVPVLVADLPEMKALVEAYEVGIVVKEEEREARRLAELIQNLVADEKKMNRLRSACEDAACKLNWESEEKRLREFYQDL